MPSGFTRNYVSRGTRVDGEGPVPCDVFICGEGPGVEEDKYGRPFVGKSGRELTRYLWQHLQRTRTSVYVTNLVKYRVPNDGDPSPDDINRDSGILAEELERVNPDVVISLGRWSSRHFLGDVDMETIHGIPHLVEGRVIFPCIHPAAGLHSTEFQGTINWDFEQLGELLRGEDVEWAATDDCADPDYFQADGFAMVADAAVDTEGSVAKPWCVSFTGTPGMACCNRIGGVDFRHIILHNAMHDIGVLRSVNCSYDTFDDTMLMAYLLCVEPQGLKALAKRHCGMVMSSYEEVLGNAQRHHNEQWLSKLLSSDSIASGTTTRPKGLIRSTSGRGGKRSARTSRTKQRG